MNPYESKHIVFVIGSMGRGGAERVISILANTYAREGWKVSIIMLLDNKNDYPLDKSIELISYANNKRPRVLQMPKWIFGMRRYISKSRPDVVVSFVARINIVTLLACFGLRRKIVVSERNDPEADGRSFFVRIATNLLYPLAHKVVFQTRWAQSCFSKRVQKKSVIIPNPIQVSKYALPQDQRKKKIVAVGRLSKQKNHELLIKAFKRVHEVYPEYKLFIYGEGDLREYLEKLIEDTKLSEAVFLPGNVPDIHEQIADAEMFVLSSNYEGLSNALLEAMMMGLPCISTDCAGSNEIIENGRNGVLVAIGSETELVRKIKMLIRKPTSREELSLEANDSIEAYSVDVVINEWRQII
ncbi:glycosyltransferase family 4 protein [Mesotoga sp.]|uniref:glycosyltransferase family 4 protein n=1 Tax=Mesotoga sp. TaxID=2053577 RepID=UPI001BD3A320|nr:glycosyltransferase family 4 protein [Mesotoga sp.]